MRSLVNQVQLIGRLGADVTVKFTNQGKKVSSFRLATNESLKQTDGKRREITQWHNCVVWGELNAVMEKYGKKGNKFLIQGSLAYRDYEDTEGVKRYITEIKVSSISLLSTGKQDENMVSQEINTEDIPF